jgi:hypothetical protein
MYVFLDESSIKSPNIKRPLQQKERGRSEFGSFLPL